MGHGRLSPEALTGTARIPAPPDLFFNSLWDWLSLLPGMQNQESAGPSTLLTVQDMPFWEKVREE